MHTTKKTNNNKLIKSVMSLAIIAGAAGAATGTYAWYSYQKDVSLEFTGTTIKADKEIQIGLRWKERLYKWEDPETKEVKHYFDDDYTLGEIETEEGVRMNNSGDPEEPTYWIYWIRGNYITDILKNFQGYIESAQEELHPITAGKYKTGDINNGTEVGSWTNFMKTPSHRQEEWVTTGAVTDYADYFYLPLVFRVLENQPDEHGNPVYASAENIYLSKFNAVDVERKALVDAGVNSDPTKEAQRQREIKADLAKAIRVKADYPSHATKAENFIFDPNTDTNKDLNVGGKLNLQPDIYYDFVDSTKKQIPYGQFEGEYIYKETATAVEPSIRYEDCSTFKANDLKYGYELDFSEGKTKPSVCQTTRSMVNPLHKDDAANGYYPIAKTDAYKNIGYLDLSIYLEGWDENIVNYTAGRTFNVELEFSIK